METWCTFWRKNKSDFVSRKQARDLYPWQCREAEALVRDPGLSTAQDFSTVLGADHGRTNDHWSLCLQTFRLKKIFPYFESLLTLHLKTWLSQRQYISNKLHFKGLQCKQWAVCSKFWPGLPQFLNDGKEQQFRTSFHSQSCIVPCSQAPTCSVTPPSYWSHQSERLLQVKLGRANLLRSHGSQLMKIDTMPGDGSHAWSPSHDAPGDTPDLVSHICLSVADCLFMAMPLAAFLNTLHQLLSPPVSHVP